MFFFGNLISFFKNRGDKAAVGTFQRERVVSASGDVTPDGGKNEAQVWAAEATASSAETLAGSKTSNFISLNPVSDSFFKAGVHVVNSV